jgi:hypothetical protein
MPRASATGIGSAGASTRHGTLDASLDAALLMELALAAASGDES